MGLITLVGVLGTSVISAIVAWHIATLNKKASAAIQTVTETKQIATDTYRVVNGERAGLLNLIASLREEILALTALNRELLERDVNATARRAPPEA